MATTISKWEDDLAVALHRAGYAYVHQPEDGNLTILSPTWDESLRQAGIERVIAVRGSGEEMTPVILASDAVLIDVLPQDVAARIVWSRDRMLPGGPDFDIWVVVLDGSAVMGRIQVLRGGKIKILPNNPAYPVRIEAAEDVTLIGRVVALIRQ